MIERLNALAEKWGEEFGYGVSDELVALAKNWLKRLEANEI
jgi:hypothetical protein